MLGDDVREKWRDRSCCPRSGGEEFGFYPEFDGECILQRHDWVLSDQGLQSVCKSLFWHLNIMLYSSTTVCAVRNQHTATASFWAAGKGPFLDLGVAHGWVQFENIRWPIYTDSLCVCVLLRLNFFLKERGRRTFSSVGCVEHCLWLRELVGKSR